MWCFHYFIFHKQGQQLGDLFHIPAFKSPQNIVCPSCEYLSNMSNNTLKLAHIFAKATFFWVLRELGSLLVYNIGIWMVLGDEAVAHWWQQSWIVKVKLDFGVLKLYGILKTLLNSILALHLDASSVFLCSLSILWPFWFQRFDPLSDLPGDATMRPPLLPSTSLTSSSPLRSSTMSPLDSASATTN